MTRRNTDADKLHDMALTAQPPLLKRSHSRDRSGSSTLLEVTAEIIVGVALTVAAGVAAKYVVTSLHQVLPRETKGNDQDEADENTRSA